MTKELEILKDEEVDIRKLLLKLLLLLKTYFRLTVICILIGISGSVSFYFSKSPSYESQMIISSGFLDYGSVEAIVKNLNELIQERNYREVANKISMDIEQVTKIEEITVNDIYGIKEKDKAGLFQLSVIIKNNLLLTELQEGIMFFLEENVFVKKRIKLKKENLRARIDFLQKEIDQIDSLKRRIETRGLIRDKSNNLVLFDPVSVYEQLVLLFEKKLDLEREVELANNFQVVEGFTSFQKPVSPQLAVYLLTGFIIGAFVSSLIISFLEFKKFARKNEI